MTSAKSALRRYSAPSDGPTEVICDAERSTGATVPSAFQIGVELFASAVCVSMRTSLPFVPAVVICTPVRFNGPSALATSGTLTVRVKVAAMSVPPVKESPRRSMFLAWKPWPPWKP